MYTNLLPLNFYRIIWFFDFYSLFFILYFLFFILYSLFFILYSLFFILYSLFFILYTIAAPENQTQTKLLRKEKNYSVNMSSLISVIILRNSMIRYYTIQYETD
ncbi:hypothetical protein U3516DRAFT_662855 [Neocallimastix sp. 'constans']